MRPLPTSPTNTFQSPKVATSDGLDASSFAPDLGAGLAALVAATAEGRRALATQTATAATPRARKEEWTRRVITNNPLNRAGPHGQTRAGASLPSDPGEIPAFRLAGRRKGCNPAF